MDIFLLLILILLTGIVSAILYLNLRLKPKDENENKETEEIINLKAEIQSLKDTLNSTINNSLVQCRLHLTIFRLGLLKI